MRKIRENEMWSQKTFTPEIFFFQNASSAIHFTFPVSFNSCTVQTFYFFSKEVVWMAPISTPLKSIGIGTDQTFYFFSKKGARKP